MVRGSLRLAVVLVLAAVALGESAAGATGGPPGRGRSPSRSRRNFLGAMPAALAALLPIHALTTQAAQGRPREEASAASAFSIALRVTESFDEGGFRAWQRMVVPALQVVTGLPPRREPSAGAVDAKRSRGVVDLILARRSDAAVTAGALGSLYGADGQPHEGLDLVTSGSVVPTPLALHLERQGVQERHLASAHGQQTLRVAQQELDLQPHDTALVDLYAQCFVLWDGIGRTEDDDSVRLRLTAALATVVDGYVPALSTWRHAASSSDGRGPLRPLAGASAGIDFLDRLAVALGKGDGGLGTAAYKLAAQQRDQARAGKPAAVGGFREGRWGVIELRRAPAEPATPAPPAPQQGPGAPPPEEHRGPIFSA